MYIFIPMHRFVTSDTIDVLCLVYVIVCWNKQSIDISRIKSQKKTVRIRTNNVQLPQAHNPCYRQLKWKKIGKGID